jgi:DNA (cytosine-5)-methyltransferase 1
VDQTCAAAILERTPDAAFAPLLSRFDAERRLLGSSRLELSRPELEQLGYAVPLDLAADGIRLLLRLSPLPRLDDLCGDEPDALWLGREWDETGYQRFTAATGTVPFVKGRAVSRYAVLNTFTEFVSDAARTLPISAAHARLAWRDVSRRSQVRRMIATLLPAGCVTGNSLHVGYFKDGDMDKLHALLGVINSLPFEFQLRSKLGTGHVSLGSVRDVHVPRFDDARMVSTLSALTRRVLDGEAGAEAAVEVAVARAYGLTREEFAMQLGIFDRLPGAFRSEMLELFDVKSADQDVASVSNETQTRDTNQHALNGMEPKIPNHYSAKLSKLDLDVAVAVPPGGNWKNIPHDVPSQRIQQIRVSFAAGEGSRSTYYGRLHPARPAYTINTYFNRPGNGCHLHYDYAGGQHRVLSEREAARIQSFPDRFGFFGAHLSVQKQIGNAVPPLLAFQIARTLPVVGQYVDLFSGAGGLSLGFRWAGWEPIVANDIENNFLESYRRNIHPVAVTGDIREPHVFRRLVEIITRERRDDVPLLVIGGPPCQGFSTAGNCRSLGDERNHLFKEFKLLVETIRPDGFVFENVTGLLNMEGGAVFEMIRRELQILDNPLVPWVLKAEEYAIPQRRTRLFLMSLPKRWEKVMPPEPSTSMEAEASLFCRTQRAISTEDALSDLPPLRPGQDGSSSDYISEPRHPYQAFMRGRLDAGEYLSAVRAGTVALV